MQFFLPLLLVASLFCPALHAQASGKVADATPLDLAREMAKTTFKDFVYKKKGNAKSIDCTEFVLAVVLKYASQRGKELTRPQRRLLTIATVKASEVQGFVKKEKPKIRGVQYALTSAGLGEAVAAKDARAGDLIQYWYTLKSGKWAGHAGIVEAVAVDPKTKRKTIHVFGSHRSTLRVRADGGKTSVKAGGIGSGPRLRIPSERYKIYVVRWKPAAPAKKEKKARSKSASRPEGRDTRKSGLDSDPRISVLFSDRR